MLPCMKELAWLQIRCYFISNKSITLVTSDICLLSRRIPGKLSLHLGNEANRIGLKTNTNKTKADWSTDRTLPVFISGQNSECFDQFTYPGGLVSADRGTGLDVSNRVNSAGSGFAVVTKIWKCICVNTNI